MKKETEPKPLAETQKTGKKRVISACILAAILIVAVFLAGWYGHYFSLDSEVRTYLWAKSVAENNYYRTLDDAELYNRLYGTLDLDPYSRLYSPEQYEEYEAEGKGEKVGLGISFYVKDGKEFPLMVFSVAEGSPACLAGVRKGMYLLGYGAVQGDLFTDGYDAFQQYLDAHPNEKLRLRCGYSVDGSDARDITVERAAYQAAFVFYRDSGASFRFRYETEGKKQVARLEEGNERLEGATETTAYIRLDGFSGKAGEEFGKCLSLMKERGRKDLILDLRSNGGGYLDILGDIASYLLRDGEGNSVIAVARYRKREENFVCDGSRFDDYFSPDSKVCVLADESTASASECLIGALVDYNTTPFSQIFLRENENGVAKTYGKGIMQSHYKNFLSGAAMKLTVATMYWPLSDKCIHDVGVTPSDGAIPVPADYVYGKEDTMLDYVLSTLN